MAIAGTQKVNDVSGPTKRRRNKGGGPRSDSTIIVPSYGTRFASSLPAIDWQLIGKRKAQFVQLT